MNQTVPIYDQREIREQIARIAVSNAVKRRRKLLELFEYLANETMGGRHEQLTQKKIAREFFKIGGSFDPKSDGTVRIAAARLRNAIEEYYRKESSPNEYRILIPARHYYVAVENPKSKAETEIELPPLTKK